MQLRTIVCAMRGRWRPGAVLRASWGRCARRLGPSCARSGGAQRRVASRAYSGHTIASARGP
eukprot:8781410-Lingulodinium_polyedra.AAC.1